MKIVPQFTQILGRVVELARTEGGIEMPNLTVKGVTILVLIDAVGEDVKKFKAGDIILPHAVNHIIFRDGKRHALVDEKEVKCLIKDAPLERFNIYGEEFSVATGARA